jgi:murein DD-endopeptidase MepM/ murein hydrolase activator NlpD
MLKRRERSKKPPRKYNVLLVPENKSGRSYSFQITRFGGLFLLLTSFILIVVFVVVVLVYTPVSTVITIPNPHLEEHYINELTQVHDRLNRLTGEISYMREYNAQMRRALGEENSDQTPPVLAEMAVQAEQTQSMFSFYDQENDEEYDNVIDYGVLGLISGPVRVSPIIESRFRPTLPISLPADGYLTRGFDASRGHFGIDIAGKMNTPIAAVADGTVIFSGWTYYYGNMVILSHSGGYFSVYKHNQTNLVRQGAVVLRGETIALLGDTGKQSYGPHLHFELWRDSIPLDPSAYLFDLIDLL